jgi:hypothetical protein
MRNMNGVLVFNSEEASDMKTYMHTGTELPTFKGLYAPFGLKTVVRGSEVLWTFATEEDYRQAEGTKLGDLSRRSQYSRWVQWHGVSVWGNVL